MSEKVKVIAMLTDIVTHIRRKKHTGNTGAIGKWKFGKISSVYVKYLTNFSLLSMLANF